jgi:hypothetical protein
VYPHTVTVTRLVKTKDGPHQVETPTVISTTQKVFIQPRMGMQRGMAYQDRYNYSQHYALAQAPFGSDLRVGDKLIRSSDTFGWVITNIENPNLANHHLELDIRGDE